MPKTGKSCSAPVRKDIEAGDVGIWATCNKGREAKCVTELKDLFQEVTSLIWNIFDAFEMLTSF
jgi:tRNA acetyltransferase TAN1